MKIAVFFAIALINFFLVCANAFAVEPIVQIINGAKPGVLEIRASQPIELDSSLYVERKSTDGSFVPVQHLDLDTMKLVTNCQQKVGKTVKVDTHGLRPVPWSGMSCSSQCNFTCDKNTPLHGTFRFVVKTADRKLRFEGREFVLP